MNQFLRIFGLAVSAAWFGAALGELLGVYPAMNSGEMRRLLGSNFPYFSGAIGQVLDHRLWIFQVTCAGLLTLHMFTEWLYFGHVARRTRMAILGGAICVLLLDATLVQPRLRATHLMAHAVNAPQSSKESAAESFSTWHSVSNLLNWCLTVGLAIQLWRLANPPEPTRFVSAVKFRG